MKKPTLKITSTIAMLVKSFYLHTKSETAAARAERPVEMAYWKEKRISNAGSIAGILAFQFGQAESKRKAKLEKARSKKFAKRTPSPVTPK